MRQKFNAPASNKPQQPKPTPKPKPTATNEKPTPFIFTDFASI